MSNYTQNVPSDDPNHAWNKIIKLVPDRALVLDVGCSSGNLGKTLADKKGCIVDGVEIDENDAKMAATKLRHVEIFDISQTKNFKRFTDHYEVLIFADVLEHLVDPVRVLNTAKSLLKPNGTIIFSIPNMAHISIRLALLEGKFQHTDIGLIDKTHLHFYTEDEVKRVFAQAGLRINHFDLSPYPYPERLIVERLKTLGLIPSEQAIKMLQKPDAAAFQFVGSADLKPASRKEPLLPAVQPIENDMQEVISLLSSKESELHKALQSIKDYEKLTQSLKRQVQDLQNSRALKASHAITGRYRKLRKRTNN